MSKSLNDEIYKRFGLELDVETVREGFRSFIKDELYDALHPLFNPDSYKEEFHEELYASHKIFLRDCCMELFFDASDYRVSYGLSQFVNDVVKKTTSFEHLLLHLQIIFNNLWKHKIIRDDELRILADNVLEYVDKFSMLNVKIKIYKTKPPQIFPSTSKRLDMEIIDTLGVLDAKKYHVVLDDFENSLKSFAKARSDSDMKSVVASLHAACDEVVKIILDDDGKSFKSATNKDDHKKLELNGYQKEIFKNVKQMMDKMKHGSTKNIDRNDVEMLISMTAAFIRFVAIKNESE